MKDPVKDPMKDPVKDPMKDLVVGSGSLWDPVVFL